MSPEFEVHMLNEEGKKKAAEIANAFNGLLHSLKDHCIGGKEFDECKKHLEVSCFYAKKAMAKGHSERS